MPQGPLARIGEGAPTNHNQQTPARSGREPHPGPSARIGEGLPTTKTSRPQPGVAVNRTQGPQPGLARDQLPPKTADSSQESRKTAPRALTQDWRGITCHQTQRTPSRSPRKPHSGPSTRIGQGPPTTKTSGPQPGVAGNRTKGPQPGLARDHSPPKPVDPSLGLRGTAPTALSQEWPGTTDHHQQQTPARNGGGLQPRPSARTGSGPATTYTRHKP